MDEKMNINNFGGYVAHERKSRGITQGDLADRCNMTAKALSNIETGKSDPKLSTIKTILDALEVDYMKIFE